MTTKAEVTARNYDVSFTVRDHTVTQILLVLRRCQALHRIPPPTLPSGIMKVHLDVNSVFRENMRTAGTLTHDLFSCIPPIFVPRTIIPGRSTDVATSGEPTSPERTNFARGNREKRCEEAARELFSPTAESTRVHHATSNLENSDVRDQIIRYSSIDVLHW